MTVALATAAGVLVFAGICGVALLVLAVLLKIWPAIAENEEQRRRRMNSMSATYEVRQQISPWEDSDLTVLALWYPEPHNCARIDLAMNSSGDVQNMTVEEAAALGRALLAATDAATAADC